MDKFCIFNSNELEYYNYKVEELLTFLAKYKHLPDQGTPEWLRMRESTIGGSELSTVIGTNPYERQIHGFVASKLGWKKFQGNKYTRWGKLFEPVGQRFMELLMQCHIYEASSLPGAIPHTSYSPDGMAVVPTHVLRKLIATGFIPPHELPDDIDALTVLFEFKSPATRVPNGKVPIHYMSQPMAGLCHFDHLDIAYFVDMQAKKCSLYDLKKGNNHYNYGYHNSKGNKVDLGEPLAYGIIGIYEPYFEASDVMPVASKMGGYVRGFEIVAGRMRDLGDEDAKMWERITTAVTEWSGELQARFYDPHLWKDLDPYTDVAHFERWCEKNGHGALGIIAYKIYACDIIPVERDDTFLEGHKARVDEVIGMIHEIRKADNQTRRFKEMFGKTPSGAPIDDSIEVTNDMLEELANMSD
jgi:hypothetical protein